MGERGLKERKALGSNYYLSLRGKYIESCQSTEAAIAELWGGQKETGRERERERERERRKNLS